jgi:hypothetical protein
VWFNIFPEKHARVRIKIGQPEIIFPITVPLITEAVGLFSEQTKGDLIHRIPSSPRPITVRRGDTIVYHINWANIRMKKKTQKTSDTDKFLYSVYLDGKEEEALLQAESKEEFEMIEACYNLERYRLWGGKLH